MIEIHIDQTQIAECQNCHFMAIVLRVANFITWDAFRLEQAGVKEADPGDKTMLICPTCYETPIGMQSPNLADKKC